jgi:hypothetical protein
MCPPNLRLGRHWERTLPMHIQQKLTLYGDMLRLKGSNAETRTSGEQKCPQIHVLSQTLNRGFLNPSR